MQRMREITDKGHHMELKLLYSEVSSEKRGEASLPDAHLKEDQCKDYTKNTKGSLTIKKV